MTEVDEVSVRSFVLSEARDLITGERQVAYGDAGEQFGLVAQVWDVLIPRHRGVNATDVALMLAGLKLVRASSNPKHLDSCVDLAGYAALAGELGVRP